MQVSLCQPCTSGDDSQHVATRMGAGLLLGLVVACFFPLTGCDQKGKPDTPPHVNLNDAMDMMAHKIGKATREMAADSPMTVTFPRIGDARFQTPCEPMSSFLKGALQSALSNVEIVQTIRWVDGHTLAQGALGVQWEQLNDSTLQLTAHLWDRRQEPARDVATVQQELRIVDLSEEARKVCLFKAKPMDRYTQAGRPLLVRTAPASEAALIENGGQVAVGTPIWVEAKIESSRWWLVRLDDDDHRVYGDRIRRGFVYGPIGATRRAMVEVQSKEPSLIHVAERHVQEKLVDSGVTFHSGGGNETVDMRLHMTVTPSELWDNSDTLVAVEVYVTLSAEDVSTTPALAMAHVNGRGKALLGSPRDKEIGLEQATQAATSQAAQALITALEQRL